jgi:hypothetical protein
LLFPATVSCLDGDSFFLTSHNTKLSRFLSRSGKAAHAFVLLSDVHQESGATLTSRSFARPDIPLAVGMLVTQCPYRERVKAL